MISASVELWETEVCFLHIQTYWHKRVTSENTQDPSWCWFWVFQVSCKIIVLKQSWCAMLRSTTHITILFVFIMCDGCKISIDSGVCHKILSILWLHEQVCSQTIKISGLPVRGKCKHFRTILRANCGPFCYWLIFFFKLIVVRTWCCKLVWLLRRFVRKFATSFHTFLCVTLQVTGPRRYCFCIRFPWSSLISL